MCDIPYNACLSCISLCCSTRFPHVQTFGPHPVWHLSWNMKEPRPTQQINNTEQTSATRDIFSCNLEHCVPLMSQVNLAKFIE